MNNRECNICYKINVDTNKCSISCSLNICDECRYEIIMTQPNSKCPQCKTGVLLNIKKINNISPEIFHTSREIFNNNFTVPISVFYPSYTNPIEYLINLYGNENENEIELMNPELPENLYKQYKSISNQMMFRISERSPSSATNNIYLLNNNILRCIIYNGYCRCCIESYCVINIVFKDFTKKIIEKLEINEMKVYSKLYNKIYEYIIDRYIRSDYIYSALQKDYFFSIHHIEILQDIVGIHDNKQICKQCCKYIGPNIIVPCPIEQIDCKNFTFCGQRPKRKDYDSHLLECNQTKYPCNNSNYGCKETFIPSEINDHQDKCIYKQIRCNSNNCKWSGCVKDFKNHERLKLDGSNWMPWETTADKICIGGQKDLSEN